MKKAYGLILCVLALCGCSTFAPMGKDTYMVCHRGSTYSTEGSLKILCLQDANKYCEQRGLAMVVVSTTGHDGSFWTSRGGRVSLFFWRCRQTTQEIHRPIWNVRQIQSVKTRSLSNTNRLSPSAL